MKPQTVINCRLLHKEVLWIHMAPREQPEGRPAGAEDLATARGASQLALPPPLLLPTFLLALSITLTTLPHVRVCLEKEQTPHLGKRTVARSPIGLWEEP